MSYDGWQIGHIVGHTCTFIAAYMKEKRNSALKYAHTHAQWQSDANYEQRRSAESVCQTDGGGRDSARRPSCWQSK